jgi:hypothetical protein
MKKTVLTIVLMVILLPLSAQVKPEQFNRYGNTISGIRPKSGAKIMLGVYDEDMNKPYTEIAILKYKEGVNEWRIDNVGQDYYTISNQAGLYLTVQGSATQHARLIIDHPNRTDSQIWRIVPAGQNTYYILSKMNENLLVTVVGPFVYLENLNLDSDKFVQEWEISRK